MRTSARQFLALATCTRILHTVQAGVALMVPPFDDAQPYVHRIFLTEASVPLLDVEVEIAPCVVEILQRLRTETRGVRVVDISPDNDDLRAATFRVFCDCDVNTRGKA